MLLEGVGGCLPGAKAHMATSLHPPPEESSWPLALNSAPRDGQPFRQWGECSWARGGAYRAGPFATVCQAALANTAEPRPVSPAPADEPTWPFGGLHSEDVDEKQLGGPPCIGSCCQVFGFYGFSEWLWVISMEPRHTLT